MPGPTCVQSERNVEGSANDPPSMVKEVANRVVCDSRDKESEDWVIESDVEKSGGN